MRDFLNVLLEESTGPAALDLPDLLLRLLVAFLAGLSVAWVYRASHSTLNYSQNFVQALVLLSLVVSVIMCVVGDSLARAFGLGAALAIVRFRTPIKDALDTAFLFLSVAVGMAAGVDAGMLALCAAGCIGAAALFLSWSSFGAPTQTEGLLRFRFNGDGEGREQVSAIVGRHCASFRLSGLRSVGAEEEELIYDLDLRTERSATALVSDLKQAGVQAVSLLPSARVQGG
jgi:hypothetical protein